MYIELDKVSRGYQVTTNAIRQTFVYVLCDEEFEEPSGTYGSFFDPNDDVGVAKFVYATFPLYRVFPISTVDDIILFLVDHSADDLGEGRWKITLVYTIDVQESNPSYIQFGVDIGGETIHINHSLEVRSSASRTGLGLTPPVTYRTIGLTRNSIEGADVLGQGLRFNITGYYTPAVWSPSVLLTWYALQSHYNNATFYGFAAGEVQLVSVSAQGEVYKKVPVTFNFLAKPNLNGVANLPFPVLFALGHDLVDYLHGEEISNNYPIKAPWYRYVHRVHNPVNFNLLGL